MTATKLPPIPGPIDSRGTYVTAFFDPTGSVLYALTSTARDSYPGRVGGNGPGPYLTPAQYDLRSGNWATLPPLLASKENPYLSQFRSDSASPLGLYALAAATSTTPPRIVVFR